MCFLDQLHLLIKPAKLEKGVVLEFFFFCCRCFLKRIACTYLVEYDVSYFLDWPQREKICLSGFPTMGGSIKEINISNNI